MRTHIITLTEGPLLFLLSIYLFKVDSEHENLQLVNF